jgi:hypothetical protein
MNPVSRAQSLAGLAVGTRRAVTPRANSIPSGTSPGRVYQPEQVSGLSNRDVGTAPPEEPATVQMPGPPPIMLVDEAVAALETAAHVQFTAIVSDRGFKSGQNAHKYVTLSLKKFLQTKSLFCIDPEGIHTVVEHMKDRPSLSEHRRTAHFVVSDGSGSNLSTRLDIAGRGSLLPEGDMCVEGTRSQGDSDPTPTHLPSTPSVCGGHE